MQMKELGKREVERHVLADYWGEFQLEKSILYIRSCGQIFILNAMQKIC